MTFKLGWFSVFVVFCCSCTSTDKSKTWIAITEYPAVIFEMRIDSLLNNSWFTALAESENLNEKLTNLRSVYALFRDDNSNDQEAFVLAASNPSEMDVIYLKKVNGSSKKWMNKIKSSIAANFLNTIQTETIELLEVYPNSDSTQYIAIEGGTLLLSNRALALEEAISFLQNPNPKYKTAILPEKGNAPLIYGDEALWQYLTEVGENKIPSLAKKQYFISTKGNGSYYETEETFCESKIEESVFSFLPEFLVEFTITCSKRISNEIKVWSAKYLVTGKASLQANSFALISIENESSFESWRNQLKEKGSLNVFDYSAFKIEQFVIGEIQFSGSLTMTNPFIVQLDNQVLFIDSKSRAELWLDYYVLNKTLGNQASFLEAYQEITIKKDVLIYKNRVLLKDWYANFIEKKSPNTRATLKAIAYEKESANYQLAALKGNTNLLTPEIVWRKELAAKIVQQPLVSENNIVVETEQPNVYFLDTDGKTQQIHLINEKTVAGPKNWKKLSWFSTKNELYVFDESGNIKENFPYIFPKEINVPVILVEFVENQPQWLVAMEENGVLAIGEDGNTLEHWSPNLKADSADLKIQFIQKPAADYIFSWTKNGKVQVFNRKGEERFKVQLQRTFIHQPEKQLNASYDRVVNIDTANYLYVVNLIGEHFRIALNEQVDDYLYLDVLGDSRNELILLSDKKVISYGYNEDNQFKKLNEFSLEASITNIFQVGVGIGLLQKDKRKIYLLDANLKLHPSFPLEGTSPFQYYEEEGKKYILVGLEQQLIKYQLFD